MGRASRVRDPQCARADDAEEDRLPCADARDTALGADRHALSYRRPYAGVPGFPGEPGMGWDCSRESMRSWLHGGAARLCSAIPQLSRIAGVPEWFTSCATT